jgi:hypothetical protein
MKKGNRQQDDSVDFDDMNKNHDSSRVGLVSNKDRRSSYYKDENMDDINPQSRQNFGKGDKYNKFSSNSQDAESNYIS